MKVYSEKIKTAAIWLGMMVMSAIAMIGVAGGDKYQGVSQEFYMMEKSSVKLDSQSMTSDEEKDLWMNELIKKDLKKVAKTERKTEPFIIGWKGKKEQQYNELGLPNSMWMHLNSRYMMKTQCWEKVSEKWVDLGVATPTQFNGSYRRLQGGFAISKWQTSEMMCEISFRGPAKISLNEWDSEAMMKAQDQFEQKSGMLEGGIGMVCLMMIIMALLTKDSFYALFGVWLFLGMRMALLSAGADWHLFNISIEEGWMMSVRQVTIGCYVLSTLMFFGEIFRKYSHFSVWNRVWAWSSKGLMLGVAINMGVNGYENFVKWNWLFSAATIFLTFYGLVMVVFKTKDRVAMWYAASMAVTMMSNLGEVLNASLSAVASSQGALNSISSALIASLLAAFAVVQQMLQEKKENKMSQRRLTQAYEMSPNGMFTIENGSIGRMNQKFRDMWPEVKVGDAFKGWIDEGLRKNLMDRKAALSLEGEEKVTFQMLDLKNRWLEFEVVLHGDRDELEGSVRDITQTVQEMDQLEFLADHDALTECMNLRGVRKVIQDYEQNYKLENVQIAYLDLDRFKLVNDLYGHKVGDEVLKQVCKRVRMVLEQEDLIARVGGDEFVLIFKCEMQEAIKRAQRILKAIVADWYEINGRGFAIGASMGLVESCAIRVMHEDQVLAGGRWGGEIIACADSACRIAKKNDKHFVYYDRKSSFFNQRQEQLEMVNVLENNQLPPGLFLVMQPILSIDRPYESLNFEVLLRMKKKDGSEVSGYELIQTAEAHGKVEIIDRWVLKTAVQWIQEHYHKLEQKTHFVCINLSGGSLNDEMFLADAIRLFKEFPMAAGLICLEITESVAIRDLKYIRENFIEEVAKHGVRVAIDDFGSDYSSFGYLKGLPCHALKIDGSLVREITQDLVSLPIVISISGLAQNLGMKTVAEFAESLDIIKAISSAGVDYVQGWAVSKPLRPEEILTLNSSADAIQNEQVREYVKMLQQGRIEDLFPDPETNIIH